MTGTAAAIDTRTALLGRAEELATIRRWIRDCRNGCGRLAVVSGGPGLGKTSLLQRAVELARQDETTVLTARAGELEKDMPLGVVRQLFERVVLAFSADERAAVLRGPAMHAEQLLGISFGERWSGDALGAAHAFYWLVANLSERAPLLVVIDDLHWSDLESTRWLSYLVPRLGDLPVLVLVASREYEGATDPSLRMLLAADQVPMMTLQPLDEAQVGEMVRREFGASSASVFISTCWRVTGGNPLFVRELLRSARQDRLEPSEEQAARVPSLGSREISRSVLVRLARLGDAARRLAEATAVLGVDAELHIAAPLAGIDTSTALGIWDRLAQAEILARGHPLQFIHPIVRTAVYSELQAGRRTELHRGAAAALAAEDAGAGRIGLHAMACAPAGDPVVVQWLRAAAADALASGASDGAVSFLERALSEPPAPEERASVLYELGRALVGIDITRAAAVLADAADAAGPELAVQAYRWRGYALAYSTAVRESVHSFDRAIALVGNDPEAALSLRAVRDYYASFWADDPDRESRHRQLRKDAAGRLGETPGERRILAAAAMSFVRFGTESAETVKALSRRAYPNAAPWVDPDDGEETTSAVGNALTYCDDDVCLELFSRWMNDLRTAGRMVNVGAEYYQRAMIHFRRGSLREAESDARTSWEILGPLRTVANHLHWRSAATLLQVLVGRGALDEAWSLTETTHLPTEPFESVITPWPPLVRGELALASGRTEEGIAILLAAGDWLEKRSFLNPSFVPWRALVAPALASVGRREEAEAIIKPAVERARAFGAPWAYGMSLRAHGIVAQQDAGIGLLFAAVELLERSACRLELAYARLALGSKLRRANRRVEAREHLRIAVDLADRCGAPKVVASALQELASTGARPRRIPLSGTASLTASERRVAELAAGGLSNPEIAQRLFVSRKTVEAHLGSIYRKLDINSRQALGRVLADDPGAPA